MKAERQPPAGLQREFAAALAKINFESSQKGDRISLRSRATSAPMTSRDRSVITHRPSQAMLAGDLGRTP
jgi:hypothetical protein